MAFSERAKTFFDWLQHGNWIVNLLLGTAAGQSVKAILIHTRVAPEWIAPIWLLTSAMVIAALMRWVPRSISPPMAQTPAGAATQALAAQPGIPTPPLPNFNFDQYFRLAHVSQLTEQTARDIRNLVTQQHPNDVVETLAKFIGIGFWGYTHEVTWPYIFRSQLEMLTELNARGGMMPIADVRAHYDRAVQANPTAYANYPFTDWLNFVVTHNLIIRHPTDMIEITLRGRDFLTFITHWGWNATMRRF